MERYTYKENGKWRMRIGDTEYSGKAVDRLAAYEDTGLEPEEVEHLKLASMGKAIAEITEFEGVPIDRLQELAQASSEALTLEELKSLNECPVWVQNLEEPEKSQWRLLYWDRGKYLVLQGISVRGYLLDEYGESWLAYLRPPEGEVNEDV